MKLKYPIKANWVSTSKYDDKFLIRNEILGGAWLITETDLCFLNMLDGKTDPYSLEGYTEKYVKKALSFYKEKEIIRTDWFYLKTRGTVFRTIVTTKANNSGKIIQWLNRLLILTWMPISILSLVYAHGASYVGGGLLSFYLGNIFGLIFGAILHECAHAIATWAIGGNVWEFGVMICDFIPGAYVLASDENTNASSMLRAQTEAAGVEANSLLMAFSLLLGPHTDIPAFWVGAALVNLLLAATNILLPKEGLDGECMLSRLFGIESIAKQAQVITRRRSLRRRVMREGITGMLALSLLYWIRINQNTVFYAVEIIVFEIMFTTMLLRLCPFA